VHFRPHYSGKKLFPLRFAAVFLGREHPRLENFDSVIPVDVIRVKCDVDSLFDSTREPVRPPSTNLTNLKRVVTGLVGVPERAGSR